jgi:hypothetical protein
MKSNSTQTLCSHCFLRTPLLLEFMQELFLA